MLTLNSHLMQRSKLRGSAIDSQGDAVVDIHVANEVVVSD